MKEWELARYVIDTKKNIDSLLFIKLNFEKICNINLKEKIDTIQREFYIKLCVVLDDVFKGKKKEICNTNSIINRIYNERDKDKAHKDKNYIPPNYTSLDDIINAMREEIQEVRKVCNDKLPSILTLDFVPHDKELFRFINGLTNDKEEEIKRKKYKLYGTKKIFGNKITKNIFNDTEEIRHIKEEEKNNFAVIMKDGINFYEGLQERQDACIKLNVLFNGNMWCQMKKNLIDEIELLREYDIIDQYDMLLDIKNMDKRKIELFNKIVSKEGNTDE